MTRSCACGVPGTPRTYRPAPLAAAVTGAVATAEVVACDPCWDTFVTDMVTDLLATLAEAGVTA